MKLTRFSLFVLWQDRELIDRFKHNDENADAALDSDSVESEHSNCSDFESWYTAAMWWDIRVVNVSK